MFGTAIPERSAPRSRAPRGPGGARSRTQWRGGALGGVVAAEQAPVYATAPPEDGAAVELTPGARGRAAVARLAEAPGSSELATAVGLLADAVDAFARADLAEEHVDDLGEAAVALQHLRARLDSTLLAVLAGFDHRQGHRRDGAVTCASWLRGRTGMDFGTASALVQASSRIGDLPRFAACLAAGDVTLAHVTAVTRAAVPGRARAIAEAEPILADLACTNPPRDVRRAVRHLADIADPDGSDLAADQPVGSDPLRELTLRAGYAGRGELEATLDPLTREALAVLLDAFDVPDPADTPLDQRRSAPQRRHDAFAALLHTLLAQPGLPTVQDARPQILVMLDLAALLGLPADHPAAGLKLADVAALLGIDLAELGFATAGRPAPDEGDRSSGSGPGAPRPTPARPARFGSGVEIAPAAVRGLLASATLLAVLTLGPWRAVNVGAKHRTLPGWLRGVLAMIHRHCRGPDCDRPATWTQAHHITDWTEAHTTDLNDTLPLCAAHHDLITTKGWSAALDHSSGVVTWTSPDGRVIRVPPPRP